MRCAGARQPALQHLRCLECYLQRTCHPAQPRILRDAQEPAAVAAAGSEVVETISLLDSSEVEAAGGGGGGGTEVIDVEVAILGPAPVGAHRVVVKKEK